MAFDEGLAARIEAVLDGRGDVVQKRMFGGLAFMVRGHMTVGVNGDELMVRVGPEAYGEALAQPHAREMDFTGKALKGFVYVGSDGLESDDALGAWVHRGVRFAESLPPK